MLKWITLIILASSTGLAATIHVVAQPVEPGGYTLRWALFNKAKEFEADDGNPVMQGSVPATTGANEFDISNVPKGTYVLTVYHDANGNGQLDQNLFGQPEEEFGISRVTEKLWSHPKWENCKFDVGGDVLRLPILMKMQ